MRIILFSVLVLFQITNLQAQDTHLSLNADLLQLNPASIGSAPGNYEGRFNAVYRDQWTTVLGESKYRNYSASYDHRLGLGKDDFWGVGGIAASDKAGSTGYSESIAGLGASIMKHINSNRFRKTFLTLGALGSFNQRRIDRESLLFADLINSGTGVSQEDILTNINFFDLGIGLEFWQFPHKNQDIDHSFKIGGAYWHVNTPNVSFLANNKERMDPRLVLNASGLLRVSPPAFKPVYLIGSLSWEKQAKIQKLRPHLQLRIELANKQWDNTWIQFGTGGEFNNTEFDPMTDAVIFDFTVQLQQFRMAFHYDMNVSPLSAVSQNIGSFELNIQYLIESRVNRKVYCPNY